jgi:hypothetical protein
MVVAAYKIKLKLQFDQSVPQLQLLFLLVGSTYLERSIVDYKQPKITLKTRW